MPMKSRATMLAGAIVFILTFAFVKPLVTTFHVKAQLTCGSGPALQNPLKPQIPSGAPLTVFFEQGAFTSEQRNTIKIAFETWKAHGTSNCSFLTFNGFTESTTQTAANSVGAYVWVVSEPTGGFARRFWIQG